MLIRSKACYIVGTMISFCIRTTDRYDLKHIVLHTAKVFTNISLVQNHIPGRFQFSAGIGSLRRHAKTKRNIRHIVHDDPGILWRRFCYPRHARFQDVVAIQEGHFRVGLQPDLVLGVLREVVQSCDVQAELATLGELANARSKVE